MVSREGQRKLGRLGDQGGRGLEQLPWEDRPGIAEQQGLLGGILKSGNTVCNMKDNAENCRSLQNFGMLRNNCKRQNTAQGKNNAGILRSG